MSMSALQQFPKPCVCLTNFLVLYCILNFFLNAVFGKGLLKDQKFEFLKPLRYLVNKAPPEERCSGGGAGHGGRWGKPVETRQEEAVADGLSGQAAH